jgi:hypothetical protein
MEEVLFKNKKVLSPMRVRSLIIRKFSCNKNKKKRQKSEFCKYAFHVIQNSFYDISLFKQHIYSWL